MENRDDFVSPEMLGLYVLGSLSPDEILTIENIARNDESVREEIHGVVRSLLKYSKMSGGSPALKVQESIQRVTYFLDDLKESEAIDQQKQPGRKDGLSSLMKMISKLESSIPEINENTRAEDFETWTNSAGLMTPDRPYKNIYIKEIGGKNNRMATYLMWVKFMTPDEVHDHEKEKFFILEGTCTIAVAGEATRDLGPGQHFDVPMHKGHMVTVTSEIPCKAILQRIQL